jgi:hypothetical protein
MAPSQDVRGLARFAADAALSLALPAIAVAAVFLSIYVSKRYAFPVGYDTPKYLWRTSLVGSNGVTSLAGSAPPPFRSNPDRAGFPVLLNAASSLLRVSVPHLVVVLPAVAAATIGLGAGAFSRLALRLARWAVPVFVLAVGASANVSRMAAPGYSDNLLVTALCMPAAAVAVVAASNPGPSAPDAAGRRGRWAIAGAIALLTAGILTHWIFVALFGAVLLGVAVLAIPSSVRTWRITRRPFATPSGRLATVVGGSALLGGIGLLTLVGSEPNPPRLHRSTFALKLDRDVPRYVFPVTGALAALGAILLWQRRAGGSGEDRRAADDHRLGAWLAYLWAATAVAGAILLAVGGSVPAHRFLAFDLGIPILAAAGIVGLAGLVARRGGAGRRFLAVVLVLVALASTTTIAYRAWSATHPWISPKQFEQASMAGTYLRRVGGTRPVVFVVDLGGASPLASTSEAFHVIRTGLAPEDIPRTYEYLGTPMSFLAGKPTLRQRPAGFDDASLRLWPSVRSVLDRRPIALMMRAFDRAFAATVAAHPDWLVAPGLAVVQGPRPAGEYPPLQPVPAPLPGPWLAVLWAAFLGTLTIVGAGWAATFVRAGWIERIALAPGFGIGAIVLGGTFADRFGLRLAGVGGVLVVLMVAACGWAAFGLAARWHRTGADVDGGGASRASASAAAPTLGAGPA